jgi:hypothetical protein
MLYQSPTLAYPPPFSQLPSAHPQPASVSALAVPLVTIPD